MVKSTRPWIMSKFTPRPNDPARTKQPCDQNPAPKQIAPVSDAHTMIHKNLTERLASLGPQKDLAFSTDLPQEHLTRSGG